jgi:rhodanese-related sulfurtransferase
VPVDEVIPRYDELPSQGSLLFICAMGARSGLACEYAAAMGADPARLFNIDEGTQAWIDKGLPASMGREK